MPTEPAPGDVATALTSLLAGIGAGGVLLALTVLAVRGAQAGSGPPAPAAGPPTGTTTLAVGSIAALTVAGGVAFARARTLGTRWQRVAVAAIAAFGTVVPGLLAMPLDRALGPRGLIVLAALSLVVAIVGWQAGRRTSGART